MPPPLSPDLRSRILDAVQQGGETWKQVAERFKVGRASVNRLMRTFRSTGSTAPKPATGGPEPKIDDVGLEVLRHLLTEKPDLTLAELAVEFGQRSDIWVSEATVGRAVRQRLKFSRKKRPSFQRRDSALR